VCNEELWLKLKIVKMNEIQSIDEEDDKMEGDQLALFLTCDACQYLDFSTIY